MALLVGVLVVVGGIPLASVSASAAQTVVVDDDRAQCDAGYSSIQTAVTEAPSGATVEVCAGTYEERVDVDPGDNATKLVANGTVVLNGTSRKEYGFEITKAGVTVRGFTVRNYTTAGVKIAAAENSRVVDTTVEDSSTGVLVDATNVTVDNVTVTGQTTTGVSLNYADDTVVADSTVVSASTGIRLAGSSQNTLRNNTIRDTGGNGIVLRSDTRGEGAWSRQNTLVDNDVSNSGTHGVYLTNAAPGTRLRDNSIDDSVEDGVRVKAANVSLSNNSITSNGGDGIEADSSVNVTIRGNAITNNEVDLDTAPDSTIRDNYVRGDLVVDESNRTTIRGNTLVGNSLKVTGPSSNVSVLNNTVRDNDAAVAIEVHGSYATIRDNVVNESWGDGIFIDAGAHAVVENNVVKRVGSKGIETRGGYDLEIVDNRIVRPGADGSGPGIELDTSNATVRGNVIRNGSDHGIEVDPEVSNVTIAANELVGLDGRSIYVPNGRNATIRANTIRDSAWGIFVYEDASYAPPRNVTVEGNTITNVSNDAVVVGDTAALIIRNNTVSETNDAIVVEDAPTPGPTVRDNAVSAFSDGIALTNVTGFTLANNTLNSGRAAGISLTRTTGGTVRRNAITNASEGVRLDGTTGSGVLRLTGNHIEDSRSRGISITDGLNHRVNVSANVVVDTDGERNETGGIVLNGTSASSIDKVTITRNVLANNSEYGVYNDEFEEPVSAPANYWGAPRPSSTDTTVKVGDSWQSVTAPFEDPMTGLPANGEGDRVSPGPTTSNRNASNVHFDPPYELYGTLSVSNTTVRTNATVTVEATLTNPAAARYDVTVPLYVNGTRANATSVTLEGGESRSVRFDTSFDAPGNYSVTIGSLSPTRVDVTAPEPTGGGDADGGSSVSSVSLPDGKSTSIDGTRATISLGGQGPIQAARVEFGQETDGRVSVDTVADPPAATPSVPGEYVSGVDVTVPDEVASEPATIQLTLSRGEMPSGVDPTRLRIQHYASETNDWTALETSVVESSTQRVVLSARVQEFSLFAITVQSTTTTATTTEAPPSTPAATTATSTTATTTPAETAASPTTTTGSGPGFEVDSAVVGLLVAGLLARVWT
ncbi:MAG: right-handed parallel beta-helix repeat-containing protein [Haloferacaceae archaeon]